MSERSRFAAQTVLEHGQCIPGVELPQWKIPGSPDGPGDRRALDSEPLLYDRDDRGSDPGHTRSLWADRPDQRDRMKAVMREQLAAYGTPAELFQRLRLTELCGHSLPTGCGH